MRKFTLYQASRFTKISRYKLEQAISDGHLNCIEGKGNVKCFINEEELNSFIESYGEQYRRFTYPDENKSVYVSDEINQFISKDIHEQLINEKDKVINLLEFQNNKLIPLLEKDGNNNEVSVKLTELKSIAESAINEISSDKSALRSTLLDRLSNL